MYGFFISWIFSIFFERSSSGMRRGRDSQSPGHHPWSSSKFLPLLQLFEDQRAVPSWLINISISEQKLTFRKLEIIFFIELWEFPWKNVLSSLEYSENHTVPTHNKHTDNKHFFHNKHTFFGLTKTGLLWLGTVFTTFWFHFYENLNFWFYNFTIFS